MKCAIDIHNKTAPVHVLDALSRTADTYKSTLVDTAGLQAVMFIFNVGASAAASTWKLVEGDTTVDSDLTDVATADYEGDLAIATDTSDDQTDVRLSYKGNKRYVGVNVVHAGTTVGSCTAIVAFDEDEPVVAAAAVART